MTVGSGHYVFAELAPTVAATPSSARRRASRDRIVVAVVVGIVALAAARVPGRPAPSTVVRRSARRRRRARGGAVVRAPAAARRGRVDRPDVTARRAAVDVGHDGAARGRVDDRLVATAQPAVRASPITRSKDPALVAIGRRVGRCCSRESTAHGTWRVGIARESRPHVVVSRRATLPARSRDRGRGVARRRARVPTARSSSRINRSCTTATAASRSCTRARPRTSARSRRRSACSRTSSTRRADRLIDPALVVLPRRVCCSASRSAPPTPARRSTSRSHARRRARSRDRGGSSGGPTSRVYGDTIENYEFLEIGGRHALLATSNQLDRPELFR